MHIHKVGLDHNGEVLLGFSCLIKVFLQNPEESRFLQNLVQELQLVIAFQCHYRCRACILGGNRLLSEIRCLRLEKCLAGPDIEKESYPEDRTIDKKNNQIGKIPGWKDEKAQRRKGAHKGKAEELNVSGTHDKYDGIIIIYEKTGKIIPQDKNIKDAVVSDITPTVLYLFDLPIGNDMDGKVLTQAIESKYLEKNPIKYIETYEGKRPDRVFEKKETTLYDKKLMKELRALGYVQ